MKQTFKTIKTKKQTVEMMIMTIIIILAAMFVSTTLTSCSNDELDSFDTSGFPQGICAILTDSVELPTTITPEQVVLRDSDFVAYDSESSWIKIKTSDSLDIKTNPLPKAKYILFFENANHPRFLFKAHLSSFLSSTRYTGLSFSFIGKNHSGYSFYILEHAELVNESGDIIDGKLSKSEKAGYAYFVQKLSSLPSFSHNELLN